jgi:hypothetical protein
MTLEEEIIETYRMDGVEDAISSGAVVTREEYDRQMRAFENQFYEYTVNLVRNLMKKGIPLEESLQEAPEQFRESIKNDLQRD